MDLRYRPYMPSYPAPKPRCTAIIWSTGRRCRVDAAEGSQYCSGHIALIAPDDWKTSGYADILPAGTRDLFHSARFSDLSEEIAVARLHLRGLVAEHASSAEVVAAIGAIARLVKLRSDLDQAAHG